MPLPRSSLRRLPASSVSISRLTHSERFKPSSCAIFSILAIAASSKLNERIRRAFFGLDFLKISSSKRRYNLSYLFNNRRRGPFCFAKSALVNGPSAPPPQATNAPAGVDGLTACLESPSARRFEVMCGDRHLCHVRSRPKIAVVGTVVTWSGSLYQLAVRSVGVFCVWTVLKRR